MEMHNVSIRGIGVDPLAHELATSEGTRPYLDCLIKAYRNNGAGLEDALQVVRDLPLSAEKPRFSISGWRSLSLR